MSGPPATPRVARAELERHLPAIAPAPHQRALHCPSTAISAAAVVRQQRIGGARRGDWFERPWPRLSDAITRNWSVRWGSSAARIGVAARPPWMSTRGAPWPCSS